MNLRFWQWFRGDQGAAPEPTGHGRSGLDAAADSLRALIDDPSVPAEVRTALASDYAQLEAMLAKLERGDLHLAVFGRVSVGKSALLNALLGEPAFEVGVLHGTTKTPRLTHWLEQARQGLHLIDTPGIDELAGEARERMAFEVAERSDLLLFVVDGDLTDSELRALGEVAATRRPILLVLNKADRYTASERQLLLERLAERGRGLVASVIAVSALPASRIVIERAGDGGEQERRETPPPDIDALRERILTVLAREGESLAALNASLFAGRFSDELGRRIAEVRRELAEKVVRSYCLAKGLAVAINPIPVADLLAAASLDIALVIHLSRVYGLPLSRREAGSLVATIVAQLALLMGAIWGVHLVSSALKTASAGLSTALTAGAQGALAWYATLLVGAAATRYLQQGRSWGPEGPKRVVEEILRGLDRDSILREARAEILSRLRR